jgi:hypothetical protein
MEMLSRAIVKYEISGCHLRNEVLLLLIRGKRKIKEFFKKMKA